MALCWSNEFNTSLFPEFQSTTMALDYDGILVLLAGQRHFSLKKLNDTSESVLHRVQRNQKYDMSSAEWNPNSGYKHHFAITTNEKVVYCSVREGGMEVLSSFKYHTRQVTDLNWHKSDPYQLVTCSADSTTLIWDSRDVRRPAVSFTAVAGVNQVRWNKLSSYLIATAHDGDLRIWDQRKGISPVQYIVAHSNKIHNIDWSPTHEYQLASCSQDGTVKLFDMTNPRRAESIMHTNGPIWRVRYTPWGEGLMTAVIQGDESSLQLWNLANHSGPVRTFVSPLDMLLEAQWRREGADYQLVTWSKDQWLRLWRIEPFLQRLCGYMETDVHADADSDVEPPNSDVMEAELATIAGLDSGSPILHSYNLSFGDSSGAQMMERAAMRSLQDEFDLISNDPCPLPHVSCDKADVANRSCAVTASVNSHQVSLVISFPPSYPYNAAPSFQIDETSAIDPVLKTKILKVLKQTAQQRVRKNRTCLESCLGQLVITLEGAQMMSEEMTPTTRVSLGVSPARVADPASVYSSFHDIYIPYPRFSGARFSSVGILVCFGKPSRLSTRQEQATPRSLTAATSHSFVGSYPRYAVSGSSQDASDGDLGFFLSDRSLSRNRGSRAAKLPRVVTVYDVSKLFFIHKELAEKYVFDLENVVESCRSNALVAASVGRPDLVQVWSLAALALASSQDAEQDMPWSKHPFSEQLLDHLIRHYASMSDIQTAAMLSCVYPSASPKTTDRVKSWSHAGGSSYHTIHPMDTSLQGWFEVEPAWKHNRSNSWSESAEEVCAIKEYRPLSTPISSKRPAGFDIREELKRRYADILHMWGLLEVRTSVMKLVDNPVTQHSGLEILLDCQNCRRPVVGSSFCYYCLKYALRCAVCRVLVRGASNVCFSCGHGGHAAHMIAWFDTETSCPTGCGCSCITQTSQVLDISLQYLSSIEAS